jgi:DsbC/DsbD-like thiol-disulfide interchange protein
MAAAVIGPVLGAGPLRAQPAAAVPHGRVRLLGGWAEPDGHRVIGLEIALDPGWKTYWRAPGDGGLPPEIDWSASRNLASASVEWPAPVAFESFGTTTLGYGGTVVLPVRVVPRDPAEPMALRLRLALGICAEICIPVEASLALDLAPGAGAEAAELIRRHRARVPTPARAAGLREAACSVRGAGDRRRFEARLTFASLPAGLPHMAVEGPEAVWFGPVALRREDATLWADGPVEVHADGLWIGRDSLRITLLWPDRALEIAGCEAAGP